VLEYSDRWDIEVALIAKDLLELDKIMLTICEQFPHIIFEKDKLEIIRRFNAAYLPPLLPDASIPREEIQRARLPKADVDETDLKLLRLLCEDARASTYEMGKALGLTEDVTSLLAATVWGSWGSGLPEEHIRKAGLDPDAPEIARAVSLATELLGFPRHLSQHVGGFVLTKRRLDETVPIGNAAMKDRTFIEWDKDDIDSLGLMKVDILALGMLTAIQRGFGMLRAEHGQQITDLADVPREVKGVYDMLCGQDILAPIKIN